MVQLRTNKDFPAKIIEIKSIYPSKEIALVAVKDYISRLLKIHQYRYYIEDDLEILRALSLYRGFEIVLDKEEDWFLPEIKKLTFTQAVKDILHYPIDLFNNLKSLLVNSNEREDTFTSVIDKRDCDINRLIAKKKALKENIDKGNTTSLEVEAARSVREEKIRLRAITQRLIVEARKKSQEETSLRVYEESQANAKMDDVHINEPEIVEVFDPAHVITKSLWELAGNTEDSIGDLHGRIVTPTQKSYIQSDIVFGKDNEMEYFQSDGINFISLPEDSLSFREDFSVRFKLFVPSSVGTQGITILSTFDNRLNYVDYYGWYVNYSNNTINVGMGMTYSDSPNFTFSEMSIKDQWVDIIITRKKSTRTTIYVNGIKTADSYIINDPIYSTGNLAYIGASYYSIAVPSYTVNTEGFKISSIEAWNGYELLQDDIDDLYNIKKSNSVFKNIFK